MPQHTLGLSQLPTGGGREQRAPAHCAECAVYGARVEASAHESALDRFRVHRSVSRL